MQQSLHLISYLVLSNPSFMKRLKLPLERCPLMQRGSPGKASWLPSKSHHCDCVHYLGSRSNLSLQTQQCFCQLRVSGSECDYE